MWTGRLQHNTGVFNNSIAGNCASQTWANGPEKNNLAALLQQNNAWDTYYGGKFLNNYGMPAAGGVAHIPPGWNDWQGLVGNSCYYDYTLSNNGVAEKHGTDYATDYLPDLIYNRSMAFLDNRAGSTNPFLLVLSFPSSHQPADPAPQYADMYPGIQAPRQPNFNVRIGDTHWFEQAQGVSGPLDNNAVEWVDLLYRRRLQTLASVDAAVEGMISKLTSMGELDNTYCEWQTNGDSGVAYLTLWQSRPMGCYASRVRSLHALPLFFQSFWLQSSTPRTTATTLARAGLDLTSATRGVRGYIRANCT